MSKPRTSNAGEHVVLHVYEPSNSTISLPGFGVYHTGIEISDTKIEYCYAGSPQAPPHLSGIQTQVAKESPSEEMWRYKESIDLGYTQKSKAEITKILSQMKETWKACDYDTVHHNCNHFTAEVCEKLGDIKYPSHINRAARWGGFFMDNNVKDRQRKQELLRREEEKKHNPFLSTKGYSLSSSSSPSTSSASSTKSSSPAAVVKTPAAEATTTSPIVSKSSATASPSPNVAKERVNPWRNKDFMPGKK